MSILSNKKVALAVILAFWGLFSQIAAPLVSAVGSPENGTVTGEFIDQHIIRIHRGGSEITFKDSNPYDDTHGYEGGPESCRHDFHMDWDSNTANIQFKKNDSTNNCSNDSSDVDVRLSGADKKSINAYRLSDEKVYLPVSFEKADPGCDQLNGWAYNDFIKNPSSGGIWKKKPVDERTAPNEYYRVLSDHLDPDKYLKTTAGGADYDKASLWFHWDPCGADGNQDSNGRGGDIVWITERSLPDAYDSNGDGAPDDALDEGADDTNEVDLTCEVRWFNPLTWIACPLVEAAQEGVQKFDNAITRALTIKVGGAEGYMNTSIEKGKAFYAAWSAFRYMALVILVIIGLIMVIAQATSASIFDAYTVKKVMPRIFIAVITITISWSLLKFAIQLTNEIGIGLRSMLFAPFASMGDPTIQQGAGSLLTLAGGVGLFGLGMLGTLTFALGALLAVIVGFGIIVFREMLVMLLVVTAPVAIICWIMPGTEKVWKMWSDFFLRALIAFPIITLMITVGHIFAKIAASGSNPTLIETTIVFICYFGPYFMIPSAFRMAGGALATVSGMAFDKSKGLSGRLSSFRGNRMKDRVGKFRSGGPYGDGTRRGRFGNALGGWVFNADEKLPYKLGKRGVPGFKGASTRLGSEVHHAMEEQTKEFAQTVQAVGGNSKTGAVLSGALGHLSKDTQKSLRTHASTRHLFNDDGEYLGMKTEADYDAVAGIMKQSEDVADRQGGVALESLKGHALNLNRNGKGYTNVAAAGGLILASHGFMTEKDLVDTGKFIERDTKGDKHFADSMMVAMEVNGAKAGLKATYSHSRDQKGNLITGTEAGRDWDLALSKSYAEIASQKKHAVKSDTKSLEDIIVAGETLRSIEDPEQREAAREYMAQQYKKAHPSVSEQKARDRFADIEAKSTAAQQTLLQVLSYTPGATDSGVVVQSSVERLKKEHNIDVKRSVPGGFDPVAASSGDAAGGGGGFDSTPPAADPPTFK